MIKFIKLYIQRFKNFATYVIDQNSFELISSFSYPTKFYTYDKFCSKPVKLKLFLIRYKIKKYKKLITKNELKNFNLYLYLKMLYISYFGWSSLDGHIKLNQFFRHLLLIITSYQYSKFMFNFFNFIDWFCWRLWFLISNQDLRTEYLKQAFFLHHYTGNLIFMFNYGLARCYV